MGAWGSIMFDVFEYVETKNQIHKKPKKIRQTMNSNIPQSTLKTLSDLGIAEAAVS